MKTILIKFGLLIGIIITGVYLLLPVPAIELAEANLPAPNLATSNGTNKFKSTIRLETETGQFYCSGAVLDGQYALTAAHCAVNSTGHISEDVIAIYDLVGVNTGIKAKAVAIDRLRDVALIRGDFSSFEFAPVDFNGEDVHLGMVMRSCGFPSGDVIWCTDLVHAGNTYFQYKTIGGPIFKGMSGGPVYSKETGRIIGVNSAVSENNVIISPLIGFLSVVGF